MAIPLIATECKTLRVSRCSDPRVPSCSGQIYDTRPLLPCGTGVGSGGAGITRKRHSLGLIPGTVTATYEMYGVPDQMDIFLDGVLVATTGGPVSGSGTLSFVYDATGQTFCTVVVTGPSGTAWNYTISCPV